MYKCVQSRNDQAGLKSAKTRVLLTRDRVVLREEGLLHCSSVPER